MRSPHPIRPAARRRRVAGEAAGANRSKGAVVDAVPALAVLGDGRAPVPDADPAAAVEAARLDRVSTMTALLAGVAHELNNPLAVLVAQAALLREEASTEAVARRADKIEAAAQRAGRIVRSFAALAPRDPPVLAPLDLSDVVDDALAVVGHGFRVAGVALERRRTMRPSPVEGDRALLGQVLVHLLLEVQAALPSREGCRITVGAGPHRGRAALTVRADGAGPAPSSLGSAACRATLDAHGGSLDLSRTRAGGLQVRVRLPLRADRAEGPAPSRPSRGLLVLVVDDEPDVARSLADLVDVLGHRAEVATSPRAAIDRLGRERFDAVFTDLRMPGLDGFDLRRTIAGRDPGLAARTVIVTGDTVSAAPGHDPVAAEPGVLRLEKPFTLPEVKALLDRVATP